MALLTLEELKEHISDPSRGRAETNLGDSALQRILDSADKTIRRRHGPHEGEVTDQCVVSLQDVRLDGSRTPLRRPAVTLHAVTVDGVDNLAAASIDSDARWVRWSLDPFSGLVVVRYTPEDDQDERIEVQLRLIRLALRDTGLEYERQPSQTLVQPNRERERERVLARLDYWSEYWGSVYA